jgi:hypothetical protein
MASDPRTHLHPVPVVPADVVSSWVGLAYCIHGFEVKPIGRGCIVCGHWVQWVHWVQLGAAINAVRSCVVQLMNFRCVLLYAQFCVLFGITDSGILCCYCMPLL